VSRIFPQGCAVFQLQHGHVLTSAGGGVSRCRGGQGCRLMSRKKRSNGNSERFKGGSDDETIQVPTSAAFIQLPTKHSKDRGLRARACGLGCWWGTERYCCCRCRRRRRRCCRRRCGGLAARWCGCSSLFLALAPDTRATNKSPRWLTPSSYTCSLKLAVWRARMAMSRWINRGCRSSSAVTGRGGQQHACEACRRAPRLSLGEQLPWR